MKLWYEPLGTDGIWSLSGGLAKRFSKSREVNLEAIDSSGSYRQCLRNGLKDRYFQTCMHL